MRLFRKPFQLSYKDRNLRFTPEGLRFFLITLGVGIAALNTGNNLLYLILAMMLNLIVVSGILSEQSVKKLSLSRSLPQNIFAGSPFWVELRLTNLKKLTPSFSLEIEDMAEGHTIMGSRYILKIPARQTISVSYSARVEKRGRYAFRGFRLTTRYPFGLFIKTREIRADREILVYPRVLPEQFRKIKSPIDDTGRFPILKKAAEGDFLGLRDYQSGDDFRSIHWKSSAKLSNLMVKEFEAHQTDQLSLVLDRCVPGEAIRDREGAFETAVSIAATLVLRLDQRGFQTRLLTQGCSTPFGLGPPHVLSIFRILSLVELGSLPEEGGGDLPSLPGSRQGALWVISARLDSNREIPGYCRGIRVQDFHHAFRQGSGVTDQQNQEEPSIADP